MRSAFVNAYQNLIINEGLKPDLEQKQAVIAFDKLFSEISKSKVFNFFSNKKNERKSLYVWGGVGRGKTMLMDLFFYNLKIEKKRRVHFLEFMQETHNNLKQLRKEIAGDPIIPLAEKLASQWDVLCLDEFQVSDIADASILGRLFTALFDLKLFIIATSNRAADDLYLGGLNRERFLPFIELLKEHANLISLGHGKDYRTTKMLDTDRYYTNDETSFEESFQTLTHHQATMCHLDVGFRKIPITRQAMGCAYFNFEDLCAQPLGGNDYLALAHAFHTIFINNIPLLTPEKRNEAKRFTHLIDALYDNRVLLIANAAAEPDKLYPKGDGSFEFERTASRLNEMRNPDYMKKDY